MIIYLCNLYFVLIMLILSRTLINKKYNNNLIKFNDSFMLYKCLIVFAFSSMLLISGLRYEVGTDYREYVNIFTNIINSDGWGVIGKIEPIFVIISKSIGIISSNPQWMFFITSLFIIYFIFKSVLKDVELYELAIFLFIAFGFYTSSFNIVRQWMAISIILYGYVFLRYKNKKKFFCCLLVGVLCHYSAIIVLLVYPIIKRMRRNITRLCIIGFGAFFFVNSNFIIRILQNICSNVEMLNKYTRYLNIKENIGGSVFVMPMFCLLTFFLYIIIMKYKRIHNIEIYINILVIGFFFSILGQKIMIFNRLQFYFVIILTIVIPKMINNLNKKEKAILYYLCLLMGSLFYIYTLINNGGHPIPYRMII